MSFICLHWVIASCVSFRELDLIESTYNRRQTIGIPNVDITSDWNGYLLPPIKELFQKHCSHVRYTLTPLTDLNLSKYLQMFLERQCLLISWGCLLFVAEPFSATNVLSRLQVNNLFSLSRTAITPHLVTLHCSTSLLCVTCCKNFPK